MFCQRLSKKLTFCFQFFGNIWKLKKLSVFSRKSINSATIGTTFGTKFVHNTKERKVSFGIY